MWISLILLKKKNLISIENYTNSQFPFCTQTNSVQFHGRKIPSSTLIKVHLFCHLFFFATIVKCRREEWDRKHQLKLLKIEVGEKIFPTGTLKPCKACSERTSHCHFSLQMYEEQKKFFKLIFINAREQKQEKKWKIILFLFFSCSLKCILCCFYLRSSCLLLEVLRKMSFHAHIMSFV